MVVLLEYCRWVVAPVWSRGGPWLLEWWEVGFGLVVIASLFVLLGLTLRMTYRGGTINSASGQDTQAFPTDDTILVGVWLILISIAFIFAFMLLLHFFKPISSKDVAPFSELVGALYMAVAAGIGAAVTTISGFNEHAAEKRDFKRSYIAWYVSRPILASLLGLVFYMAMRAGIFVANGGVRIGDAVVVVETPSPSQYLQFAFIGALVGMFAKPATEKLRELFDTFFQTKSATAQSILDRLPQDLRDQVSPYVPESGGPVGSGPTELEVIAKVPDEDMREELGKALEEQRKKMPPPEAESQDRLVRFYAGLEESLQSQLRPHLPYSVVEKVEGDALRARLEKVLMEGSASRAPQPSEYEPPHSLEVGPDDV
jgi:hypothetical protein